MELKFMERCVFMKFCEEMFAMEIAVDGQTEKRRAGEKEFEFLKSHSSKIPFTK